MSKFSKQIVSLTLTVTTAVSLSGALLFVPATAVAQSSGLQDQINQLLAQIQTLQGQLASQGGSSAAHQFSANLTVGSRGDDVTALQNILISGGYLAAGYNTGYFGGLTRAAVVKWQKAAGVSPAAGYVGIKSRTALNAMGGGTVGGGNPPPPPPPAGVPPAPSSGLAIAVASNNPASGALISSTGAAAARVPVLAFNLTAGTAGAVTISNLSFKKNGVLSDNAVSGAYLVENGKVLYQYTSLNKGVINFSGIGLSVDAGKTRKIWLAIDPAQGLSTGNTVSFTLDAVASIVAADSAGTAVVATGSFPLSGGTFTVTSVSNPNIASVTIASSSVGSQVYAGTQNVLVSQWTATVNNSPVNLTSLNFRVVGSANKSDIKNVKLMINGTQAGQTLASVSADGAAYFDLSASPAKLNTGSSNVQVVADVMGSPSFTFQFELLNTYDVYAVDTQYQVPVSVTVNGGSGVLVTIQQGQITVTADSGTPTSNLAKGASGSTFAKFDIYAAGEAIKVKFLQVQFVKTGGTSNSWTTSGNFDNDIRNVQLVDDAGNQIGTTINTVGAGGTGSAQCSLNVNGTTVLCNFGTSGSPITYIVPANTTRVISAKGDIQTGASFTTVLVSLVAQSSNLQGLTSNQTNSSGAAQGSTLTLASTALTVTKNGAVSNPTYTKGSTAVKVGSFVLTASSAEGASISNFTVTVNASSTNFQNLKAMVGSSQIGITYPTLSASTDYTFSGNIPVPVGATAIVDVYADVLNSANGVMGTLASFKSCTGTGASTFSSISCGGTLPVAGQTVTIAGSLTVSVSNNISLPNRLIVMGNTGVSLAKLLLTDTTGIEAVRVQQLKFTITTGGSVGQAFSNLKLYDGTGAAIAGAGPLSMTSAAPSYVADFNFGSASAITVPFGGTLALELRGDVSPFTVSSNIENATSAITIAATGDIVAFGKTSNISVTMSGTPSFATVTTLRSKLNLAGAVLATDSACGSYTGSASINRSRASVDYLSCLKLSADSSGQEVRVNTLSLTFSGAALGNTNTFAVQLIDPSTQTNYDGSSAAVTCNPTAGNSCSVTFSFSGTPISAGTTKGVVVQINSTNFANVAQQYDGLDLTLNAGANVAWADGTSGIGATTGGLALSSDVSTPLLLSHVDYQ